jgi:DNA mismatch endonuclease (patch repair protein)
LPGRPDLVFPGLWKAIFVHGCFWHRHPKCRYAATPTTRYEFWQRKFEENRERDKRNLQALSRMGWESLVVWECELRDLGRLEVRLRAFLDKPPPL